MYSLLYFTFFASVENAFFVNIQCRDGRMHFILKETNSKTSFSAPFIYQFILHCQNKWFFPKRRERAPLVSEFNLKWNRNDITWYTKNYFYVTWPPKAPWHSCADLGTPWGWLGWPRPRRPPWTADRLYRLQRERMISMTFSLSFIYIVLNI